VALDIVRPVALGIRGLRSALGRHPVGARGGKWLERAEDVARRIVQTPAVAVGLVNPQLSLQMLDALEIGRPAGNPKASVFELPQPAGAIREISDRAWSRWSGGGWGLIVRVWCVHLDLQ
jgi:hypothetical protein